MSLSGWILVALGAGAGTYMLRSVPFVMAGRYKIGERGLKFLTYTSLAFFAGIVSKGLVMWKGQFDPMELGVKLTALVTALVLYARYKSILLSLFAGVAFAVALRAIAG